MKTGKLTPSKLRGTYPSRSSILDHHHSRSASSPFRKTTIRSPWSKVNSSRLCASYANTAYTTPLFIIPNFSWTPAKTRNGKRYIKLQTQHGPAIDDTSLRNHRQLVLIMLATSAKSRYNATPGHIKLHPLKKITDAFFCQNTYLKKKKNTRIL